MEQRIYLSNEVQFPLLVVFFQEGEGWFDRVDEGGGVEVGGVEMCGVPLGPEGYALRAGFEDVGGPIFIQRYHSRVALSELAGRVVEQEAVGAKFLARELGRGEGEDTVVSLGLVPVGVEQLHARIDVIREAGGGEGEEMGIVWEVVGLEGVAGGCFDGL